MCLESALLSGCSWWCVLLGPWEQVSVNASMLTHLPYPLFLMLTFFKGHKGKESFYPRFPPPWMGQCCSLYMTLTLRYFKTSILNNYKDSGLQCIIFPNSWCKSEDFSDPPFFPEHYTLGSYLRSFMHLDSRWLFISSSVTRMVAE